MFLAGDIGGTKTHLAFFDHSLKMIKDKIYSSKAYDSVSLILQDFLHGEKIQIGALGIAGPVRDGKCHATNLPWVIDEKVLSKENGNVPMFLLNDLEANAYGIPLLKEHDFVCLQKGEKGGGNRALISAGTGLGEAGIYWDGKKHIPFACEGGHADFAPRNEIEIELLTYLWDVYEHVSYERVLSGNGFYHLYRFLVDKKGYAKNEHVESKKDPKLITEMAVANSCPTCIATVEFFCKIYGAEAGNLALKMFASGGLYIGGGIAPKIIHFLQKKEFLESFSSKGRFSGLLQTFPVFIIKKEETALLGAADFARQRGKNVS